MLQLVTVHARRAHTPYSAHWRWSTVCICTHRLRMLKDALYRPIIFSDPGFENQRTKDRLYVIVRAKEGYDVVTFATKNNYSCLYPPCIEKWSMFSRRYPLISGMILFLHMSVARHPVQTGDPLSTTRTPIQSVTI